MKKAVIILVISVLLVIVLAKGALELMNARTFQLYGNIVPRVETEQKVVALTFDDGPTLHTAAVLEVLAELDIQATFFLTGQELRENPDEGNMIALAGHEIGNHSYSHSRLVFKAPSVIRQEIDRTNELIRGTGYDGDIHFRPPNGKKLLLLPRYLASQGMQTIMWDIEPDSYPDIADDARAMADYVMGNIQPGSIILLHAMYDSRTESVAAIAEIANLLRSEGYKFVTVSELLPCGQ